MPATWGGATTPTAPSWSTAAAPVAAGWTANAAPATPAWTDGAGASLLIAPELHVVHPLTGGQGAAVSVALAGRYFTPDATVAVSGAGVTVSGVTVSSSYAILATFTVAAGAATGVRTVTVTTAGGTSGTASFEVTIATDITQLVSDLGGDALIAGLFDARYGVTESGGAVSSWRDARGSAYAALTQATASRQPTYSGSNLITFDGSDDYLSSTNALVTSDMAGASAIAYVGTQPAIGVVVQLMYTLSDVAGGAGVLYMQKDASSQLLVVGNAAGNAAANWGTVISGVRVSHGRRTTPNGSVTAGARVGAAAEAADAGTSSNDTPDTFVLGANSAGASNAAIAVRAVILYKGDDWTSASKYATFNTWAAAQHSATI